MRTHRSARASDLSTSLLLLTLPALPSLPGAAQQAYFSTTGEITTVAGQHVFGFELDRALSPADDLRFLSIGADPSTNAAGDAIGDNNFDGRLFLDSGSGLISVNNDDGGPDIDALLTWPGIADSGGSLPATGLPVDTYLLRLIEFGDNQANEPWGTDLVGPADALILRNIIPSQLPGSSGVSQLDSLKFGTRLGPGDTVLGTTPATFNFNSTGGLTINGPVAVANTGYAELNVAGNLTATGPTTVGAGGTVNVGGGNLTIQDDLTLESSSLTPFPGADVSVIANTLRVDGTTTVNQGGTLDVRDTGNYDFNGDINVDGGSFTIDRANSQVLATGQTFRATNDAQVRFDATGPGFFVGSGQTYDILSGSNLTVIDQLTLNGSAALPATLTVVGAGSTLTKDNNFSLIVAQFGNTATLNLRDQAVADVDSGLIIATGFNQAGANGTVNVESAADLNVRNIRVGSNDGDQGTGTINLTGDGSTITLTGSSNLVLGNADTPGNGGVHILNIEESGVFTTGTGTNTVNATGELRVESNWDGNGFQPGQLVLNGNLLINEGGQLTGNGVIAPGTTPGGTITNAGTLATASEVVYPPGGGFNRWSTQIDAPYTQTAAGTMTFELADIVEGSGDDQLSFVFLNGDYTLAGEARFIASHPGNPLVDFDFLAVGESAKMIDTFGGSSRTGVFDTVTGHILGDGTALAVLYNGAEVAAQRVLYGDANRNGQIEQGDLNAVLNNWGSNNLTNPNADVSWVTGDFDGDGQVAQGDLNAVLNNWGDTINAPDFTGFSVPEPAAAGCLVGLAMLLRRRSA